MQGLKSKGCPSCGGVSFERLLDFGPVPVSGRFRTAAAEPVVMAQLAFELCAGCGLVRYCGGTGPRDYRETDRATAKQFPAYGRELVARLASQGVSPDDLVLDIGTNDGSFMAALRDAGFRRLVGVEPSRALAEKARARGFEVENDYFGPQLVPRLLAAHGRARALVCRHTLEHVPDPGAFVSGLRDCLETGSGVALVEVPDGLAIPELMNVYEFWDEHLYCFCAANLAQLVERAGFRVREIRVQPHLATRNLLLWCATDGPSAGIPDARNCVPQWRGFARDWPGFRDGLGKALRAAPRPLYLIGGSHPQYNLVNYAGLGALVDHFIDDDPGKAGRYPPIAAGAPSIISTAQFMASARRGSVLKTGFGYEAWTAGIAEHAQRHGMSMLEPFGYLGSQAMMARAPGSS